MVRAPRPPAPARAPASNDTLAATQPNQAEAEREAAKQQFVAAQLQAQFEADAAPTRESTAASVALRQAFTAFRDQGANATSIECRHRICRMEIEFRDLRADIEVFDKLMSDGRELSKFGGMITLPREVLTNGTRRTVVYLARQGDIEVFE